MAITTPDALTLLPFVVSVLLSVSALIASAFTWHASRAKRVRVLEDQILDHVRLQQARADQIETKLGEWGVTVTSIVGEVEDFFDRTVKERQRIAQQNARAEQAVLTKDARERTMDDVDMSTLPRAQQLQLVDEHFRKQGR